MDEGKMGSDLFMGMGCSYGVMKSFKTRESQWLHNIVNTSNTTEMYTLKWLIVCYVNFT